MHKTTEALMKEREPVHEKCLGEGFTDEEKEYVRASRCSRMETFEGDEEEVSYCKAYVNPSNWWKHGRHCPLGDHFRPDLQSVNVKVRAGQQKQKKRR